MENSIVENKATFSLTNFEVNLKIITPNIAYATLIVIIAPKIPPIK